MIHANLFKGYLSVNSFYIIYVLYFSNFELKHVSRVILLFVINVLLNRKGPSPRQG